MGEAAIRFQDVGKRFDLSRQAPRSVLESLIQLPRRLRGRQRDYLWAVRDVSFDVRPGESVGLVGHNGSGKSTLLKLATRILRPTTGAVQVNGRVSALLELGAGFHNDLSGRENVYLNASVLGLRKREIDARFDEIVAFSELDKYIDMPVKHYSSGMYMRLGFAVAVHCDPDILLVDEILAVGDSAFQRKCIDRIHALRADGVTIMMVSHHLDTLAKLCNRLVWMDQGAMRGVDATEVIVDQYVEYMNSRIAAQGGGSFVMNRSGNYDAEITGVRLLGADGQPRGVFQTGDALTIEMRYVAHRPIEQPELGFAIVREDGLLLNGPNNRNGGYPIARIEGSGTLRYHIAYLPLLPGAYELSAAIQDGLSPQVYDFHARAYPLRVAPGGTRERDGLLALQATWEWEPDSEAVPLA